MLEWAHVVNTVETGTIDVSDISGETHAVLALRLTKAAVLGMVPCRCPHHEPVSVATSSSSAVLCCSGGENGGAVRMWVQAPMPSWMPMAAGRCSNPGSPEGTPMCAGGGLRAAQRRRQHHAPPSCGAASTVCQGLTVTTCTADPHCRPCFMGWCAHPLLW